MPRTRLDRFSETPESYRRDVNRVVKTAMARSDISSNKELAEMLKLTSSQIHTRFKSGFDPYELKQLNRILKFTDHEREVILGESI